MTRRLVVWLFLVILLVGSIAWSASNAPATSSVAGSLSRDGVAYSGTVVQDGDDANVAMVPITGTLVDGDSGADGTTTGGDDVVRMLDAIADDADTWDGVILELDTPGGSVLASEEITAALQRLHDAKVPVVAWMRSMAASAGYYVSAGTDRIVASRNTFTGSIGVILEYYVVSELAEKVGVSQVTIKSGKLKDIGNPMRPATAQERQLFQGIIDEAYGEFVSVVAEGRDMDEAEVRRIGDGRIYTGAQAKELGLVDELGLRDAAYDAIAREIDDDVDGEDIAVTSFRRSFSLLELLGADVQPSLDSLARVGDLAGAIRGDRGAAGRLVGNGLTKLEYRAVLG
jgi:protease-4